MEIINAWGNDNKIKHLKLKLHIILTYFTLIVSCNQQKLQLKMSNL